jgi:hypothetical protein
MAKIKPILSIIPSIYRKNYEDIGLFFWIEAQRSLLPTLTIRQSIERYFEFIGIDWDYECAETTYQRLRKDFLNVAEENTKLN